jgi:hypothetical protein
MSPASRSSYWSRRRKPSTPGTCARCCGSSSRCSTADMPTHRTSSLPNPSRLVRRNCSGPSASATTTTAEAYFCRLPAPTSTSTSRLQRPWKSRCGRCSRGGARRCCTRSWSITRNGLVSPRWPSRRRWRRPLPRTYWVSWSGSTGWCPAGRGQARNAICANRAPYSTLGPSSLPRSAPQRCVAISFPARRQKP